MATANSAAKSKPAVKAKKPAVKKKAAKPAVKKAAVKKKASRPAPKKKVVKKAARPAAKKRPVAKKKVAAISPAKLKAAEAKIKAQAKDIQRLKDQLRAVGKTIAAAARAAKPKKKK